MTVVADTLSLSLAILFACAALLHLAAPRFLAAVYRQWGYARGFPYVAGAAQALAALFLAVPQTRIWGGILAGAILFSVAVFLLNHRRYLYALPVILLMIALAPAMA